MSPNRNAVLICPILMREGRRGSEIAVLKISVVLKKQVYKILLAIVGNGY